MFKNLNDNFYYIFLDEKGIAKFEKNQSNDCLKKENVTTIKKNIIGFKKQLIYIYNLLLFQHIIS